MFRGLKDIIITETTASKMLSGRVESIGSGRQII